VTSGSVPQISQIIKSSISKEDKMRIDILINNGLSLILV
jgi:hypothetical protein